MTDSFTAKEKALREKMQALVKEQARLAGVDWAQPDPAGDPAGAARLLRITDDIGRFLESIAYPEAMLDTFLNTADQVLKHLGSSMDDMDARLSTPLAEENALLGQQSRIKDLDVQHPVNTFRRWQRDMDIWIQNHGTDDIWA